MTCDRKNDQIHNGDNFILEYPNMLILFFFFNFLTLPFPLLHISSTFYLPQRGVELLQKGPKRKRKKKKVKYQLPNRILGFFRQIILKARFHRRNKICSRFLDFSCWHSLQGLLCLCRLWSPESHLSQGLLGNQPWGPPPGMGICHYWWRLSAEALRRREQICAGGDWVLKLSGWEQIWGNDHSWLFR